MPALDKAGSNDLSLSQCSARADSKGFRSTPNSAWCWNLLFSDPPEGGLDLVTNRECHLIGVLLASLRTQSHLHRPWLRSSLLTKTSFAIAPALLLLWTANCIMGFDCGCAFAADTSHRNFAQMGSRLLTWRFTRTEGI